MAWRGSGVHEWLAKPGGVVPGAVAADARTAAGVEGADQRDRLADREFAVVPIELWNKLADQAEALEDAVMFAQAKKAEDGTRIPADVLQAELLGDHPIKAWRQHRQLTQDALAAKSGISKPYLSQIENRKRDGTADILATLAKALSVPMELLHEGG